MMFYQSMRLFPAVVGIILSVLAVPVETFAAATITVVNMDGANEGFNDPTPFTPIGGNTATTLGEARLNAFEYAATIWGDVLTSSVEIKVNAAMDPLGSGILGQAGPTTVHHDFTNAPLANTWYVQALANKFAGMDLDPTTSDIGATFSSNFSFYFGLDGNPPGGQYDFVSVVLHELGHGLGFLSLVNLSTGVKFSGADDVYSLYLEHHGAIPADYPTMTNGQRVVASTSGTNLHFTGSEVIGGSAILTTGKDSVSGHVEMYAPVTPSSGSSVSHFNKVIKPDQLMEHSISSGEAIHDVGLAAELFADLGWDVSLGPTMTSPSFNSTLGSSAVTFQWTSNGDTIEAWWLYVGSSVGADDLYKKSLGSSTSVNVTLLPTDGRTLYVRLWYQRGGVWQFTDGQYTAATLAAPIITSPVAGSILGSSSATFQWTSNGDTIEAWWLYVGSSVGADDLYKKSLGSSTSVNVTLLPTDGRTLYVRLWYQRGGVWQFTDGQYTAATLAAPIITSPVAGSILGSSSAMFQWTSNGDTIEAWWLYVGSSVGADDLYKKSLGSSTSVNVTLLPTDGRTLYVRLWYQRGGVWQFTDEQYTAATLAAPIITSPVAGSILGSSSATFQWTSNGDTIEAWWLYVGSSVGADDLYKKSLGSSTSVNVTLLPTDGRTLYVRLWYQRGGVWQFTDGQYTAATLAAPIITSPVAGSILGSSSATFQWTSNGDTIEAWWLYVGSSVGADDLYKKSLGSSTSVNVTLLPTDGRTLYVRLWYQRGGVWQFTDGQFTASNE